MPFDDLLIGLAGIADLAGVKRQVVTMWRRRFGGDSADPFPDPVGRDGEQALFDPREVARWLEETNHGNNPHARSDAAAHAMLRSLDGAGRDAVDELLALVALATVTGDELPTDADELLRAARRADPHDTHLVTEVARHVERGSTLASSLGEVIDGFFAPDRAIARIERAVSKRDRQAGTAGALSDAMTSLLADVVAAMRRERGADIVLDGSIEVALAQEIWERDENAPLDGSDSRAITRYLAAAEGELPDISVAPVLNVTRISGEAADAASALSDILASVEDLAPGDALVVIGPAAALVDPLTGSAERARDRVLRSGSLRAVARLPKGHVLSAVQQPLALWILTESGPAASPHVVTADVSARTLDPAVAEPLVNDLLAAVWPTGVGRAFAIAKPVLRRAIIARSASLVAGTGVRHTAEHTPADQARPFVAFEQDWNRGPSLDEPPLSASSVVAAAEPRQLPRHRLGELVEERHARIVPGTRLADSERNEAGFEVLDPEAVHTGIASRRVDALSFATNHPNAHLSRAGDVVFVTSPRPHAMVDREGSRVVAYPARVLRIDAADSAGLVPQVAADDIARADGSDWRSWQMRRVVPAQRQPLADALDHIDRTRDELRRRLALADELASQLTDAVAAGASHISLTDTASPEEPHQKESA